MFLQHFKLLEKVSFECLLVSPALGARGSREARTHTLRGRDPCLHLSKQVTKSERRQQSLPQMPNWQPRSMSWAPAPQSNLQLDRPLHSTPNSPDPTLTSFSFPQVCLSPSVPVLARGTPSPSHQARVLDGIWVLLLTAFTQSITRLLESTPRPYLFFKETSWFFKLRYNRHITLY